MARYRDDDPGAVEARRRSRTDELRELLAPDGGRLERLVDVDELLRLERAVELRDLELVEDLTPGIRTWAELLARVYWADDEPPARPDRRRLVDELLDDVAARRASDGTLELAELLGVDAHGLALELRTTITTGRRRARR